MKNMEKERRSSKQYGSLERTHVDAETEKPGEFWRSLLDLIGRSLDWSK